MVFSVAAALLLAGAAAAQTLTSPTACTPAGAYTLCQNLWGRNSGTGSQNSTLISTSGNAISWSTTWTWANSQNSVKSYANVQSNSAMGVQLSNIASAPTAWNWTYESQSSGIRADVSYDMWLGTAQSGSPATTASSYEIMIWLSGKGGIQPVGSQITTATPIAGYTWNLWKGPNSNWEVFSFVSSAGDINNFSADLNEFFQYLVQQQGVSSAQYVQAIQTGTEPFTGSAMLMIDSFSVAINADKPPASSSVPPASSTAPAASSTVADPGTTTVPASATVPKYGQCGGQGFTGPTTCAAGSTCKVSNPYYSQCL